MCDNNLKHIGNNNHNTGDELMCKYKDCGTAREKYGYCVECGQEICEDCASPFDKNVHKPTIDPRIPVGIDADPCIAIYSPGTAPDSGHPGVR